MSSTSRLLSARLFTGNVIWSLAGAGLPLLVGLWAIPLLIHGLGKERFGLLAIIWMGIGYFSLFDLGIGRALTKLISERLGSGNEKGLPHLIKISVRLMFVLGIAIAAIVIAISPVLIEHVLHVQAALKKEGIWSFSLLAVVLPFVVSTAGLIGILQAHQRFRAITLVRIPLGIVNFLGPVLILPISKSLVATTIVLAGSRIIAWLAYYSLCKEYQHTDQPDNSAGGASVRQLLAFGGWITVSNIIGPIMVYFDRLLIGSVLGLVAVAYYTTPYEIVTRLWIIPNAIADVLFPALTAALAVHAVKAKFIYAGSTIAQAFVMFPLIALLTLYAPELLNAWVGAEFAKNSTIVLHWLALGVYINCFARMPYALLQGHGRPDITAKLHLVEMPIYLLALWWMMSEWGITGAAMAWTGRIIVDTLMLFILAAWQIAEIRKVQYQAIFAVTGTGAILAVLWFINSEPLKAGVVLLLVIIAIVVGLALLRTFPRMLADSSVVNLDA